MSWIVGGVGALVVVILGAAVRARHTSRVASKRLLEHRNESVLNISAPNPDTWVGAFFDGVNRTVRRLRRRRRDRRGVAPEAVAAWCDSLARHVRGGSSLRECVRFEMPSDAFLADLTTDLRRGIERGQPLAPALDAGTRGWKVRPIAGIQHLELAISIISSASAMGGSAAAPLDKVGAALRLRSADGQERAAHSAQARLSAHVLTVVPLGILTVLITTDPGVRLVVRSAAGVACVAVGSVLNAIGWSWMRRIIGAGK